MRGILLLPVTATLIICLRCQKKPAVIDEITATNKASDHGGRYHVENLLDANAQNSWVEGSAGDGIGDVVTLHLAHPVQIRSIIIRNGFWQEKSWAKKGRVKELLVTGRGADVEQAITLHDDSKEHTYDLKVFTADQISLTIQSVYSGNKGKDTALSSVTLPNASISAELRSRIAKLAKEKAQTPAP